MANNDEGIEQETEGARTREQEAIQGIIDKLSPIGDLVLVEGRVTEMSITWQVKRGEYNSDTEIGEIKIEFDNLPCSFLSHGVERSVREYRGTMGIVGDVFRQASTGLAHRVQETMNSHMEAIHTIEPKEKGLKVKPKHVEEDVL